MIRDEQSACQTCAWPLDCCPETGVEARDRTLRDCPREQEVWERRLADEHWSLADETPLGQPADLPAVELVFV